MSTSGEAETRGDEEKNAQELGDHEASRFKGLAARANYLSADRPDLMYNTKEMQVDGETHHRRDEEDPPTWQLFGR